MEGFKTKKFLFKLIATICLFLTIWTFGIMSVAEAAISSEERERLRQQFGISDVELSSLENQYGTVNTLVPMKSNGTVAGAGEDVSYWRCNFNSGFYMQSNSSNIYDTQGNPVGGTNGSGSTLVEPEDTVVATDKEAKSSVLSWGGQLLQPIIDLVMSLGDACMNLIQSSIMGGTDAYIAVDKSRNWWLIITVAIIAVVAIAVFVIAMGGVVVAAAAIGNALSSIAGGAGLAALAAQGALAGGSAALAAAKGVVFIVTIGSGVLASLSAVSFLDDKLFPDVTVLPLYSISPEEIFQGNVLLFDVNIFNPKEVKYGNVEVTNIENGTEVTTSKKAYYYVNDDGEKIITSKQNSAMELKKVVAKWYYTLRNLAIVALMVILVYIGIKILLSSVSADKAKYKQMLLDWIVALCLVFVLHYIMIFAIDLTESITDIVKNSTNKTSYIEIIDNISNRNKNKYEDAIAGSGVSSDDFFVEDTLYWPTNLIGHARIQAQLQDGGANYVGYALAYVVLVMFTVFFTFTYAKRLLYIVFLTVIAPLVAITYPIDKINDGKAQGFDMWLKEYIFNLLIQPLHLLLYTLLITMAFDLAGANIIYTIVAIGFMMPAEKFLRKMFNFEKASTPGVLGGAAGAALVMSGLNSLSHLGGGAKNRAKGDSNSSDSNRINYNRGSDSGMNFDNVMGGDDGGGLPPTPTESPTPQRSDREIQEDMHDADSDNFGTDEWDPTLFAENANNLYGQDNTSTPGMPQSVDEARMLGEELGYEGEDLDQFISDMGFGDQDDTLDLDDDNDNGSAEGNDSQDLPVDENIDIPDLPDSPTPEAGDTNDLPRTAKAIEAWKKGMKITAKGTISNIPGMIGTGLRFTGAATGAVIGTAATIASGDPKTAVKNVSMGAVAGKAIGNIPGALGQKVVGGVQNTKEQQKEFEKEYYGKDYAKHRKQQEDLEFRRNRTTRDTYAEELGINDKYEKELKKAKSIDNATQRKERIAQIKKERKDEINKVMQDAVEYRKFNVTDDKVIIGAMQIDKENPNSNRTSRDKIASAIIASKAKNNKDVTEYIKRLTAQGLSETDANKIADNAKLINRDI